MGRGNDRSKTEWKLGSKKREKDCTGVVGERWRERVRKNYLNGETDREM